MKQAIIAALSKRFNSYNDLARSIEAHQLGEKLDAPRHKSLLEHLWCVVGARESYARALMQGSWDGFACSMSEYTHDEVIAKLESSADAVMEVIDEVADWDEERERLLIELSEHEVMHEGGIIRHMYAFELEIPASVRWA